jgi:UDP-glucose 4-epimerase
VRDYIHVSDVARGLADIALGETRGVFNLGTGTGTSVADLLGKLIRLRGQSGRTVISQVLADSKPSTLILDSSKMRTSFGWRPIVALSDGLGKLLKD